MSGNTEQAVEQAAARGGAAPAAVAALATFLDVLPENAGQSHPGGRRFESG
jgi:hypothetical protein